MPQRGNHCKERGRVLHGVTRDLWQIVFDAQVPPPAAAADQVHRTDVFVVPRLIPVLQLQQLALSTL